MLAWDELLLSACEMDNWLGSVKADSLNPGNTQIVAMQGYGISVQAAIGPKVLDGGGLEGRVVVAFTVSMTGSVLVAHVAQSSGHNRLDAKAVQIVGQATLPTPPCQCTSGQRSYISAFTFK
jgi:TonB family protein